MSCMAKGRSQYTRRFVQALCAWHQRPHFIWLLTIRGLHHNDETKAPKTVM